MSLQRLAVISAIGTHGVLRNRTIYYDRPLNNDTFRSKGISFNQTDSLLVGCVSLSFVIIFMCIMCYCYNKSIDKTSMDVYRRHLMEAANNQNMDIYTVEQSYETEAYAPLCETQSAQSVLPPSYEDVMAAERDMLKKYRRNCTSNTCCEYLHLNRSHPEQTTSDNNDLTNTVQELRVIRIICDKANTDTKLQIAEPTMYDDNGNEIMPSQCLSAHCSGAANSNGNSPSCRMQNDGCCTDNCPIHCVRNDAKSVKQSLNIENNNNNDGLSDDLIVNTDNAASQIQDDYNNNNNNNNNPNLQSMGASSSVCQCSHIQNNNDSKAELNILSDNGIIRMDMSKVIDQTGLPTYDAAIKLKSFGYV